MSFFPVDNSDYAKLLQAEIEHVKKLDWKGHKLSIKIDGVEKEETKKILLKLKETSNECTISNLVPFGGDIHVYLDGKFKTVIERKAGMDLVQSIQDGRFSGQLSKLSRLPTLSKNVIVLLEKKSFEKARFTIGLERLEGTLSDIQARYTFQIWYSLGIESTLYQLLKHIKKIHAELPVHLNEIRPFVTFEDYVKMFDDSLTLVESFSRELVPHTEEGIRSVPWRFSDADLVELKTHAVEKPLKLTCEKAMVYMLCAAQFSIRQALTIVPHFDTMQHLIHYLDQTDPQEVVNFLGWLPMIQTSKELNFRNKEYMESLCSSSSSSFSSSCEETLGQAVVYKLYQVLLDRHIDVKRYTKVQMERFEKTGKRPNFRPKKTKEEKDEQQPLLFVEDEEEGKEEAKVTVVKQKPKLKKKKTDQEQEEQSQVKKKKKQSVVVLNKENRDDDDFYFST